MDENDNIFVTAFEHSSIVKIDGENRTASLLFRDLESPVARRFQLRLVQQIYKRTVRFITNLVGKAKLGTDRTPHIISYAGVRELYATHHYFLVQFCCAYLLFREKRSCSVFIHSPYEA